VGAFAKVLVEDVSPTSSQDASALSLKLGKNSPDASTTYLGSNLWENTIPFDPGFKESVSDVDVIFKKREEAGFVI